MKTFFYLSVIALALLSCAGNSDASLAAENEKLRQRFRTDSLMLAEIDNEMREIDSTLFQITELTQIAGQAKGKSQTEKVAEIKTIIDNSLSRIKQLEEEIAQSNSSLKNNAALLKSVEAQKKLIEEQQRQIDNLNERVTILTGENKGLKDENQNLTQTVNVQSSALQDYQRQIEAAQQKLNDLNAQISSVTANRDNINKQVDKEYFAIAQILIEMAEDQKGIFKNAAEQRKSMTQKAFEYYCKLHKRGVYEGMNKMNELKSHSKLGKFVQYESCK